MIDLGKEPDGAFFAADEGMATNILAGRLAQLVQTRMLAKKPYAREQRKEVYRLTEKRLAFMPSLLEVAYGCAPPVWIALVNEDKTKLINRIRKTVQRSGSIFVGADRIVGIVRGKRIKLKREPCSCGRRSYTAGPKAHLWATKAQSQRQRDHTAEGI